MKYSTSMVKVEGKWQQMLIVSDAQPLVFEENILIEEQRGLTIKYYTNGLYKEIEEDGVYYYWFILNSKEEWFSDAETIALYENALNVLGVETEAADEKN